jgi:hypothetical protein
LDYVKATWGSFSILVGLNGEIISPLLPTIDEDLGTWNAGNLGDRRPQVRLDWDEDLGDGRHLLLTARVKLRRLYPKSRLDGAQAACFPFG